MDLDVLLRREPVVPFGPGTRIPWDDPDFSARMLREHLTQDHDRASRRLEVIERQVAWVHGAVLRGHVSRILDLGCGPGLYTSRLAHLGHTCVGIDFSPASIAHAEAVAHREDIACTYEQRNLHTAAFDGPFDTALFLFGEVNTFTPAELASLLSRVRSALAPGGRLVLEPQSEEAVRATGEEPPVWSAQASGLFADTPHLTLRECAWHEEHSATTERYFVFGREGPTAVYAQSTRAYSDDELGDLLEAAGFAVTGIYESIGDESEAELYGVVAEATHLE